jgi:hypothetical protein
MLRATTPTGLSTSCLVNTYVESWGAVFPFPQAACFSWRSLTAGLLALPQAFQERLGLGRNRLGVSEHCLVEGGVLVPHGEVLPDDDTGEEETQAEQHEGETLETEPEALGLGHVACGLLHAKLGLRQDLLCVGDRLVRLRNHGEGVMVHRHLLGRLTVFESLHTLRQRVHLLLQRGAAGHLGDEALGLAGVPVDLAAGGPP